MHIARAFSLKVWQKSSLALPLAEVMTMVSRGLMSIALAMLIKLALTLDFSMP
jgi:hypothetical protein